MKNCWNWISPRRNGKSIFDVIYRLEKNKNKIKLNGKSNPISIVKIKHSPLPTNEAFKILPKSTIDRRRVNGFNQCRSIILSIDWKSAEKRAGGASQRISVD